MKAYFVLGGMFLLFVVVLFMALSSNGTAPKTTDNSDKGSLELVYDPNSTDPEQWSLHLTP